jgi:hypothetical protein
LNRNPYASPQSQRQTVSCSPASARDLYVVAWFQRRLLDCLWLEIGLLVTLFLSPVSRTLATLAVVIVPLLPLPVVVGAILVFLLVHRLGSGLAATIFLFLALVPVVGFLVMLAVSARATQVLRANGFHAGLLGTDLAEIRAAMAAAPSQD